MTEAVADVDLHTYWAVHRPDGWVAVLFVPPADHDRIRRHYPDCIGAEPLAAELVRRLLA